MGGIGYDIENDVAKGTDILNEINKNLIKTSAFLDKLKTRIKNSELPTETGLSILELKNQSFMSYLCNFAFTNLLKLNGDQFEGNSTIDRLIENRVLLEKIRPLEFKLKNQISKYTKAQAGSSATTSAIRNNSLDDISDFDSSENEESSTTKQKSDIYRVTKIAPVVYSDGKERDEAQEKRDARERKRYLESDMMADAFSEYNEDPTEIHASSALKRKALQKIKQIQKYEEDNFTRLVLSKKDKLMLEQVSTPGNLASELLNFRSLDAIGKVKEPSKRKKNSKFKGSKKRRR